MKRILKINLCIKEVKRLSNQNIIICAEPYHCSTQKTVKYVNYFKKNGADIVSLILVKSTIQMISYTIILKKLMTKQTAYCFTSKF